MLCLQEFTLPTREQEESFFASSGDPRLRRTCYTTKYPFGLFRCRQPGTFSFAPLTVFCGGNGSGKSTVLNVMAEKLGLRRGAPCNRSDFFDDYVKLCWAQAGKIPPESRIVTSDDVFDYLLDLRTINEQVDQRREKLFQEYTTVKYAKFQMRSLADYEQLKDAADAVRHSQSRFVRERLMENPPEQSNGESALHYFAQAVGDNALYLLDEPENSLSSAFQQKLAEFLENAVRFFGCQLVIATHSPFLLAIPGAKIYDLDAVPVVERRWTELENVRIFRGFFQTHAAEFSD